MSPDSMPTNDSAGCCLDRIKTSDKSVRVAQVIITNNATRGDGKNTPIRPILQVWSMDGELIAERAPADAMLRARSNGETE